MTSTWKVSASRRRYINVSGFVALRERLLTAYVSGLGRC